jgi:hypothetical protein
MLTPIQQESFLGQEFAGFQDTQAGDHIECFTVEEVRRSPSWAPEGDGWGRRALAWLASTRPKRALLLLARGDEQIDEHADLGAQVPTVGVVRI